MLVTVAICTWNRRELLDRALNSMQSLSIPGGLSWELLVVNNNSTDQTAEVITSFEGRLPIRQLFEPRQGKSHALNRAIEEARGEYIVWTDDDALVDPQWLTAYASGFARWPEAAMFGGPVLPWFEGIPPQWLREVWPYVGGAFAIQELGETPTAMTHRVVPFGVNMAIRRREQARHPYDPRLGRTAQRTIPGGEDTGLIRRLLDEGHCGWMLPDARVKHFIPLTRQTEAYLRRWYYGYGQYLALDDEGPPGPAFVGKPLWLWRRAVQSELAYRLHRLTATPSVWIEDLKRASESWGALHGARREPPEAPNP